MNFSRLLLTVLLAMAASACEKKSVSVQELSATESASVSGMQSKAGAFLAYEHSLQFEIAPAAIAVHVSAVQSACNESRFGACSVLSIESSAGQHGSASLSLRVVPSGVEHLVALAGEGAELKSRETRAEDLAEAVADVASARDLLERQRVTLLSYVERKDLSVTDMITLSQQLASVESQLQQLSRDSAQHTRRIESNLLTLKWSSNVEWKDESSVSLSDSWATFTSSLAEGVDGAAEYAGFLLPILVLFFPFALFWRWAWRRATRASRQN